MRKVLYYFLLAIGAALVLYLSWRPLSSMETVWFIPRWLAHWADESGNGMSRTAVPFVPLGLLAGWQLNGPRGRWWPWLAAWAALAGLVLVAEAGQLLLAQRYFQWYDVAWGTGGALVGLGLALGIREGRLAVKNAASKTT